MPNAYFQLLHISPPCRNALHNVPGPISDGDDDDDDEPPGLVNDDDDDGDDGDETPAPYWGNASDYDSDSDGPPEFLVLLPFPLFYLWRLLSPLLLPSPLSFLSSLHT